ncbi:MAG: hypothetical protein JRN37_06510 [Nitrososphaerota archaeon]|nr:hypothetical protein [Nitrososphaerota archaeon]
MTEKDGSVKGKEEGRKKEKRSMTKISVYYNNEYYDSLEYSCNMTADDREQLIDDAMDVLEGMEITSIHVGTNRFKHLAVFAESE